MAQHRCTTDRSLGTLHQRCCPPQGNPNKLQGRAPAKFLAPLAGKDCLAVAGKFRVIPKGYHGLVYLLLETLSYWWYYGGIMGN